MAEVGKFHWSLYFTDDAGVATRCHWAVLPPGSGKVEGVIIVPNYPVTMYIDSFLVTFAFFKISGFTPPDFEITKQLAINAFDPPHTAGYATVVENRKKGLTCRTWAMKVYKRLLEAGFIQRDVSAAPDEIEALIRSKSIELEQRAAEGKLETSEIIVV
ncbi:hypothetical protein MD484_g1047, partial [Candolleomyces efflorescens]